LITGMYGMLVAFVFAGGGVVVEVDFGGDVGI
jgi:hypothetical protein